MLGKSGSGDDIVGPEDIKKGLDLLTQQKGQAPLTSEDVEMVRMEAEHCVRKKDCPESLKVIGQSCVHSNFQSVRGSDFISVFMLITRSIIL